MRYFIILGVFLLGCDDTTTASSVTISKASIPSLTLDPPPMPRHGGDGGSPMSQDQDTPDGSVSDATLADANLTDAHLSPMDQGSTPASDAATLADAATLMADVATLTDAAALADAVMESDVRQMTVDAAENTDGGALEDSTRPDAAEPSDT